jgi:hypothetical protein
MGYNLYYGTSSTSMTQTQRVGGSTQATISGLTTGKTYYFAVTAYNAAGSNSAYSNIVSFTPTPTPTPAASQPPALAIDAKTYGDQLTASATVVTPSFSTVSKNELLLAFVAADYKSGANTTGLM